MREEPLSRAKMAALHYTNYSSWNSSLYITFLYLNLPRQLPYSPPATAEVKKTWIYKHPLPHTPSWRSA
jgi:hypothetical protein